MLLLDLLVCTKTAFIAYLRDSVLKKGKWCLSDKDKKKLKNGFSMLVEKMDLPMQQESGGLTSHRLITF